MSKSLPLSVTHPALAKQAHGWDPSTVTAGSGLEKAWVCERNHVWQSTITNRTKGRGCHFCSGRKVLKGVNDLATTQPGLSKQAHGWDPTTVTSNSSVEKEWICDLGHQWFSSITNRVRGRGCPICSGQRVLVGSNDLATLDPELAKQAHGWDPSSVTVGSGLEREWICELGHLWSTSTAARSNGHGCPICSGQRVLVGFNDLATFNPELAKQANGWNPSEFTRSSGIKKEWKCELGHIWSTSIADRTKGNGCPTCSGRIVVVGFNDLATLNAELADEAYGWDPTTVSQNSGSKREWRCSKEHTWFATINNRTNGSNCPICSGKKVLVGFNDLATVEPELAEQAHGWDPRTVTRSSNAIKEWKCHLGHVWKANINSRSNGNGCVICAGQRVLAGFNDLATVNPTLANQAYEWDPGTVTPGAKMKRQWKCELGHIWGAVIYSRSNGTGCPVCSGKEILVGFNDLQTVEPEIAKQAHGWDPTGVTRGSKSTKKWKCNLGHVWESDVAHRSAGSGCPTCAVTGFDPNSDGYLYFLEHPDWEMFQIGITNFPDDRLGRHKRVGWQALELRGPMDGHLTAQWETSILRMLKAKGADLSNPKVAGKFDGFSEAWSKATFEVKSIKELMKLTEKFENE